MKATLLKPSQQARTERLDVRYDLIPTQPLRELAAQYAEGAQKYGDGNFVNGLDDPTYLRERYNHLRKHLEDWAAGDRSEPHLAKAAFGIFTLMCATDPGPMDLTRRETKR